MGNGRISGTQVVQRAARILKLFVRNPTDLRLAEIAESLELHPTTAYRILHALISEGFIAQDPQTKRYRLGQTLITLGEIAQREQDLTKIALPHARYLASLWGETTCVDTINSNMEIITVVYIPSSYMISQSNYYNLPLPPHTTSTGKAIMAFMPESQIKMILDGGLIPKTPKSITDPEKFLDELKKIRTLGYATNIDELEIGLNAVGAPIRDTSGREIAAISTGGPSARIPKDRLNAMGEIVVTVANRISKDLGYVINPTL